MSSLTVMLHRAGLLTDAQIAELESYRTERSLRPIDAILQLGLLEETELVTFIQGKLMIPIVAPRVLEELDTQTVGLIPADLAWLHSALPVSVDDFGNLTLAMADPTDSRAVDAIAAHTGTYLIRAVAALTPLRHAVAHYFGPRPELYNGPPTPVHGVPIVDDGPTKPLSELALFELRRSLSEAGDRDAITTALVDFLAKGFLRVILFVHLRNQLRGRDARGPDLLREAVTQVRIPTSGPSIFADVIEQQTAHFGPWPHHRKIDKAFSEAMGGITGDVLVLPIALRDKIPLLLFASEAMHQPEPGVIEDLSQSVSEALERLIFRRKTQEKIPKIS